MEKQCFKCRVLKPLTDFYKHSGMADGRLGKCKECNKRDVRENCALRREKYAEYERQRFKRPLRKLYLKKLQVITRQRFPEKYKARQMTGNAIRDGRLLRQPCERQPCDRKAEAHHEDYSKPLEIRWLCFKHHREEHGQVVLA